MTQLNELIQELKRSRYRNPLEIEDEEALGVLVANYFKWDVRRVFETLLYALEDSNYHSMVGILLEAWNSNSDNDEQVEFY